MSEVGVNFLRKMSRKKLNAYISNLESAISKEDNPNNIKIFKSWLSSAYQELNFRTERRMEYLTRNNLL